MKILKDYFPKKKKTLSVLYATAISRGHCIVYWIQEKSVHKISKHFTAIVTCEILQLILFFFAVIAFSFYYVKCNVIIVQERNTRENALLQVICNAYETRKDTLHL